jgi:hypothetical protein
MARRTRRARVRSGRRTNAAGNATSNRVALGGARAEANLVPRAVLGAVNGVEVVAVGALQLTRDILLSTVSGAANIGAEALTATVSGIRGVVSATSHMVGDIAGTAQATFQEALSGARQTRRTAAATGLRRPTLRPVPARGGDSTVPAPTGAARARRRGRQPRAGGGQAATVAA